MQDNNTPFSCGNTDNVGKSGDGWFFPPSPDFPEAYGHIPGVITLSLTQTVAEGEDDLTPSPHTTAVAGDDVEKYELTISYLPFAPAIADYHTGTKGTGSHGAPTDNIVSDNVHEINVYIHKLEIEKTDQDGNPLPGAVFTLYRVDDEHGEAVAGLDSAHKYTEAAAAVSGADGIAHLKHGSEDFGPALGETYYLIETAAPEGYTMESTVRTIEVQAENGKYTDLNGNAIASDTGITDAMYPFNWDQGAMILLDGNPAAVITKGEAGGAAATVTDGAYVSHDSVISFRHTVINTPMTAAITIYGAKVLEGRAMTEDDVFTFELVPAQQVTGRYPGLPESNVLTVQNNAEGVFSFTLNFDYTDFAAAQVNNKATFTYLVTEKPPEGVIPGETDPNTGMQYSTQQFWVQVDLEMAEGELRVSEPRVYIKSPPPAAGTLTRKNEPLRNRA